MDFWLFLQVSVHLSLSLSLSGSHTHTLARTLVCLQVGSRTDSHTHRSPLSRRILTHMCEKRKLHFNNSSKTFFFVSGRKKPGETKPATKRNETRPKKSSATPDFDANEAFARRSCGPEPVGWNYGLQIRMKIILVTSIIISWLSLPDKKESGRSRSGKSSELAKSRTKPG